LGLHSISRNIRLEFGNNTMHDTMHKKNKNVKQAGDIVANALFSSSFISSRALAAFP